MERWRLLRALQRDILELAEGDRRRPATEEEIEEAVRSMLEPSDTVANLREALSPNLPLARVSFGVNAAMGAITAGVGVFLLLMFGSLQYWASAISLLLVAMALIVAGTASVLVYATALLSPAWASRRRYGVPPAAAICLFVLAALTLVAGVVTGLPPFWPWSWDILAGACGARGRR